MSSKKVRIIGELLRRDLIFQAASPINVTWQWYLENQGVVQWNFQNTSSTQQSFILLRNGYYFGNAFYPIYVNYPFFGVNFTQALTPLQDLGVENNAPPVGIINFGNNQLIVAFIFTLAAGQLWSLLEGGFDTNNPPQVQAAPVVTLTNTGNYCIEYSEDAVYQWQYQTGTSMTGFSPNPSTFSTVEVTATNAPYINIFSSNITQGICNQNTPANPSMDVKINSPCVSSTNTIYSYSINVTNNGNVTLNNVTITNTLPNETTFSSFSSSCNNVTLSRNNNNNLNLIINSLDVGNTCSINLNLTISQNITQGTSILNKVQVKSNEINNPIKKDFYVCICNS